jgi:hypothetical protein
VLCRYSEQASSFEHNVYYILYCWLDQFSAQKIKIYLKYQLYFLHIDLVIIRARKLLHLHVFLASLDLLLSELEIHSKTLRKI